MVIADQRSRLPWWHRRVVCVSDDEAWAIYAGETIRALGGWPETLTWSGAATLEGPVGALVVHVDVACADVETLIRWAAAARQPKTLLWVPPSRRVARIGHTLDRLRYRHVFERASTEGLEKDLKRHLPRILSRGGWIVPWYAEALGWSAEPFLVHVLSLPVLAERPPENVREWRRAVGKLNRAELVELCRERGAPSPKELHDCLKFSEATVWAAEQRFPPTRDELARHLHYSSGWYTMQRAHRLAGLTYEDIVERPVVDVLAVLTRPLLRVRPWSWQSSVWPTSGLLASALLHRRAPRTAAIAPWGSVRSVPAASAGCARKAAAQSWIDRRAPFRGRLL